MTKILFLHGGFGNALLEIAHVNKYEDKFFISTFFTGRLVRNLLGLTNHPNFVKDKVKLKEARFLGLALVPLVAIDAILAKVFRHSLFTEFDINFVKSKPILINLAYFGYFQTDIDLESVINVREFLVDSKCQKRNYDKVVIHIRGGDFVDTSQALGQEYYYKALKYVRDKNILSNGELVLVTNDLDYSHQILKESGLSREMYNVSSGGESEDFDILNNCKCLISSNSTFALTAAITNPNYKTIVLPRGMGSFVNIFGFSFVYIDF